MHAGFDAEPGQGVRAPVRPFVELPIGETPFAEDDGGAVGNRVRDRLEEVGQVELHGESRSWCRAGCETTAMAETHAAAWPVRDDGTIPKERYLAAEFLDLELERMWSRVWQVAGREEELGQPGDYLEYTIGDESILDHAWARRRVARRPQLVPAPRHSARTRLRPLRRVRRRRRHPLPVSRMALRARRAARRGGRPVGVPATCRRAQPSRPCASTPGAGSCSCASIAKHLRCSSSSIHSLRCSRRTTSSSCASAPTSRTVLPANWKVVIEAFCEGYHVQGTHPETLPWVDDVGIEYEQFTTHAHYGRLANARRILQPSPRLGIEPDAVDEGKILRGLVAGLGGAFLGDERAAVDELIAAELPPGELLGAYQTAPNGAARGARLRRLGLRARSDDERRRRVLVPEPRRSDLPGQRHPVPRPTERARPRQRDQGHVGARMARGRRRVADAGAPPLRRLARSRLGPDHEPGLLQHGTGAGGHEVARLHGVSGSRSARRATSSTCTASSTATSPADDGRASRRHPSRRRPRERSVDRTARRGGRDTPPPGGRHLRVGRQPRSQLDREALAPGVRARRLTPGLLRAREVHQPERDGRVRRRLARYRAVDRARVARVARRQRAHRRRSARLRDRRTALGRAHPPRTDRRATDRVRPHDPGRRPATDGGPRAAPLAPREPRHQRRRPVPPDRRRGGMGRGRRHASRDGRRRVGRDARPLVGCPHAGG